MANKNSVDIQLNINTAFKNVKQAVDSLKKELSNINISGSLGNDLVNNFQKQATQIKQTLSQVGNFDFSTGDTKEYSKLVQQLKNEYASLNSMVKQYSDTFISTTQKNITKQTEAIAAQKKQKEAYDAELNSLTQGKAAYDALQNGSSDLTAKEKELAATYEQNIPRINELNSEIKSLSKSMAGHKGELTKNEAALKTYNQVLEVENQQSKVIKNEIEQVINSRKNEVVQIKETAAAQKAAVEKQQKAILIQEKLTAAQNQWQSTYSTFVSDFERAEKSSNALTDSISRQILQWTSFTAIIGTAKRAISEIIQTYQELDDNLSAISAVSGISTQQLWGDMPSMIDNANKLALTVDDLTNGMLLFYQQGLSAADTEIRLEAAGKMAAISQQDLATAVDQLTSAMNAFNMTSDQAQNVVDVYAALAGATAVDVQELAAAMSRTASIAQNAGLTFEQTAAFLTTMEETTRLSSETIGNSFKSIIARFTQLRTSAEALEDGVDANKVETALKTAGVALRDANGEFRDLGEVLMELSSKWDTLDSNTQKYIATTAAGTQQQSNFIALISQYQANIDNLNTAYNAAGAAEQQFQAISNNLTSAFNRLDNSFTALQTSWTDGINVLTMLTDVLSTLLLGLSKIPTSIQGIIGLSTILLARTIALSAAEAKRIAIQKIADTINFSILDNEQKDIAAKTVLTAVEKNRTTEQLKALLVQKGFNEAQVESIANTYAQVASTNILGNSFKILKGQIAAAAKSMIGFVMNPANLPIVAVLSAIAIGIGVVTYKLNEEKKAAEETQETIDQLNQSSQEHADLASQYTDEAKSLEEYSQKLKEAYANGQDLTDLKTELANTFGEETLGVDAQKVSYQELSRAIEDAIKQKKELIQLETAESLINKAQSNQTEAERLEKSFQKTKPEKQYYDSNGDLITDKAYQYAEKEAKGRLMDVEDVLQEKGYTTKLIYNIEDGGEVLYQGDLEGYQKKLQSLQQQFYTESEAQSLYTYAKDKGADFGDNLNENQIVNTIQLAAQQLGSDMTDPNNGLSQAYFDFQNQIETVQQQVEQQMGISIQEFFDFLNGNYSNLSTETLQSLTNYFNQLNNDYNTKLQQGIDLTPAEEAIRQANNDLEQTFNDEYSKIADYDILTKEQAQTLGLKNLERIVDAFEAGGDEAAKTLRDLITGVISDGFSEVEISPEQLEGVKSQFEEILGDSFNDIDFSSLETAFEGLMDSYNQGDIDFSQIIDSLELLEDTCPNAANALQEVISALQAEKAAQEDTFASMTDVNNAWSNFNDGIKIAQNLVSETGATFDEVNTLAQLLGTTIDQMVGSGQLQLIGENYHTNAQQAQEWITSLYGLSDAQLASAQAEYESTAATASAAAQKISAYKSELDAAIANAKAVIASGQANAAAGPSFNALKDAGIAAAKGLQQLNIQLGEEAPGVEEIQSANLVTADSLNNLVAQMENYSAELGKAQAEQEAAATTAKNQANFISNLRTQLTAAKDDWKNYGSAASSGGGGGGSSAADGTNEATEALEAQKEALEEQKDAIQKVIDQWDDYKSELEDSKQALEDQKSALEDLNDKLKDNLELYLDLIKTRLEDEIDKQTTAVESFYDAIKDAIQKEIDAFDKNLDELSKKADELQDKADKLQEEAEKQEDSLNKLYDAATSYYDAVQSGIENEINLQDDAIEKNEYKISLLEDQKDAIQEQIDNLDTAADSESKLLALEKARDALANARNQKTRMVLTNGGGWRLKTDTSAVQEAQSNLADAERDYQKELLERQQDKLDEQISQLEEENDKIEDIQDSLEAQNDLIDNIKQDWDDAAENLGKTTSEIEEQTRLLQMIASSNDAQRQDLLAGFQSNIAQNNNQYQNAADASNAAEEASNRYDYQNNADNQDSIAAAIEALKEQQNLADESMKEYFENILSNNAEEVAISQQMQALVGQLIQNGNGSLESFSQFRDQVNGAFDAANEFATNQAEYINRINEVIAYYEEWSNRLDMTSEEINQRQQIMNEINNATLSSLLEGGSTFNQLQGQYNEIIRNNDEAVKIQGQIDDLDTQIDEVQGKIDELKAQQDAISEQEKALEKANSDENVSATKNAGNNVSSSVKSSGAGVVKAISSAANQISSSVQSANKNITVTVSGSGGGVSKPTIAAMRSKGGPVGFSTGGVDDFTSMVAVHGTKNRPELVLNNSQSAALFKYIDSMTRIPTLSSAGSARNALQAFNTTNNTTNEGTSFTGCEFNIESNANNLDSLVKELKQSSSIRRK